ncbi:hypothetical protein HYH03_014047 [Edaphochlamys debaryana]|uniref:Glycoside hydrolase family 42 N-terminal domain-containing protein n=1 Tax=Edaphochlamys debaryana TaxID=47281 RepID=A0A836BSC0_9CHLO|nr:hypothetical protein HYH03_014047 [Edaphochlamys debaryana]|eukprot:KAG2487331.1 hypothetical protein HYH03_014047 [Edaphochlamys debaryana]
MMKVQQGFGRLQETVKKIEAAKIKMLMTSCSWDYLAPSSDPATFRWAYLDQLIGTVVNSTSLKVAILIDVMRYPKWLHKQHPDCNARDAGGREYRHLSWFHPAANEKALGVLQAVSKYLATKFQGRVVAIQPGYNNEYEAKFTQEYDSFQDYNVHAMALYRAYLRDQGQNVDSLNRRWGTTFKGWDQVEPPRLNAGSLTGIEESSRYWDWQHFRVSFGASVFNKACGAVKAGGLLCYHHTPEFFSVLDAMYGASLFKYLSASPNTDFIIMDSNFRTPNGQMIHPQKLRVYISAAIPYGKPVYFEAAMERYNNMSLLVNGFKASLLAGAPNLGITNWLQGGVPMDEKLTEAMQGAANPAPCAPDELVGVFIHLDSCSAWTGLQWQASSKAPLHEFIDKLAWNVTARCETDLEVHVELGRFLEAMPRFNRAVFVEPLILYGSAELKDYVRVKTALDKLPHAIFHLPTNSSRGLELKVFQDLRAAVRDEF